MSSSRSCQLISLFRGVCQQCRRRPPNLQPSLRPRYRTSQIRFISTSGPLRNETDLQSASPEQKFLTPAPSQITAAPPLDLDSVSIASQTPARIIPVSPSYFTASPTFNDHVLLLHSLLREYGTLPTVPHDRAPRTAWLKLAAYRTKIREPVTSSKYSKVLQLLRRLNKIHPKLRTAKLYQTMDIFRRPDVDSRAKPAPAVLDEQGRSSGVGRRKESSAKVYLVEGRGEVLINGKSIVQAFPRLHDRESALWALKVTGRLDKYNVFAVARGGGVTGQAESVTLGLARALMVHEPALKPTLRKAGCVTFDARRVERKKPGRVKARKRPTWTKR